MAYVYIAGPYTVGDTILNIRRAILAADQVAEAGHVPFVPHLAFSWHLLSPHDYEFWINQDIAWLLKCDAMIRLAGKSPGANREGRAARRNNIPVFYSVADFLKEFGRTEQ